MFSAAERERIREALIDRARADAGISGAALVGSAARGLEDKSSDIDLAALQLAPAGDEAAIVDEWSAWMDAEFEVA